MTGRASTALIFQTALRAGLKRSVAQVFAVIAYWDQIDGGRIIKGRRMRWRSVREIADETGYSERSVTRALSDLRQKQFIESQVIWSPSTIGNRVNAFGLLPNGTELVGSLQRPERRIRSGQNDAADRAIGAPSNKALSPDRKRQNGCIKYSEQDQSTDSELVTLPLPARESQFHKLETEKIREADIERWFEGYLSSILRNKTDQATALFWAGLGSAMGELAGLAIEPFDKTVSDRVAQYLSLFTEPRNAWLSLHDPCAFAVWAKLKPIEFNELVAKETGTWPKGSQVSSWHLSKYGFAIINRVQ